MNDEIYLIYSGFEDDVDGIFANMIKLLKFKIYCKSDYRLELSNSKSKILIISEISLSIWIYNQKYPRGILLSEYLYNIDKGLYNQFVSLAEFFFNNRIMLGLWEDNTLE